MHLSKCATPPIDIGNGVLQGDCLSPLLFSLLVSDFERYLDDGKVDGVGVGPRWALKCLFYADDLVLLARSKSQLQKALHCLEKFCDENLLTVNTEKTKVVIFRARNSPSSDFTLYGEQLEVVHEYLYLGILFSENGTFSDHEADVRRKIELAAVLVRSTLSRACSISRPLEHKLFQAKICSVMLYGAEFWALWSGYSLEQIQLQYYKRLFFLHTSTPAYVVRHHFGLCRLQSFVIERALRWYNKILCMPEDRWPRRCLMRLLSRDDAPEFNWLSQLRLHMSSAGLNLPDFPCQVNVAECLETLRRSAWTEDCGRCDASSHCTLYATFFKCGPLPFDELRLSLRETRLVLQVALQNNKFQTIFWKGRSVRFTVSTSCPCCVTGSLDTIEHFVSECPRFGANRQMAGLLPVPLAETLPGNGPVIKAVLKFIKASWPLLLLRNDRSLI